MAEKEQTRDITDTDGADASRGTPVRRSTRLNSASTPAPQPDGASTPKSKIKPTGPSSENSAAVRRSLRLSLSKPPSPEDKLLKKVVTRRASTNAISTPRRQSQDSREADHASPLRPRSRRCVSESPSKKDQTAESDVVSARRSTRLSIGRSSTPSKQLWSSKSRKNLAAVSEDPSESPGMISTSPPLKKIAYEEAVILTPLEKQHSHVAHIEGSPSTADLKNEGLQEVQTHTCEQPHDNANNSTDLLGDSEMSRNHEKSVTSSKLSFTDRSSETLDESTQREPQIVHIKEEECDLQSGDVALTRTLSNLKALTSEHIASNANPSPQKVAIGSSAQENIDMSPNKSHLIQQSGDICVATSPLISSANVNKNNECYLAINTEADVSVSNGIIKTPNRKNSQAKSRLSSEILPRVEKENNMFQAGSAAGDDDNKHSVSEFCSMLDIDSCETYSDKQTSVADDPAPDDFHLEMNGCHNNDDGNTDIKIQHSTTSTSINAEVSYVNNQKLEENNMKHELGSTAKDSQIMQDANVDDEKENNSLCTNMDHIRTAGEHTSANSFSNKTPPQNGNKKTRRLSSSLTKRYSTESLTDKELSKNLTLASTTPNKNGFVMQPTVPDNTLSVFKSKDSNSPRVNISDRDIEEVQSNECVLTMEDVAVNGHLSDENQATSNVTDNCTSEGKPNNMQQNQGNISNDDEDDIFSEGSLSFDSDAIRSGTVNELMKTKNDHSEVRDESQDESVPKVGPISKPSPLPVTKITPDPLGHNSSGYIFSHSPKVGQDNPGSNSEKDKSSYLKGSSTPKVKKRKHQHNLLPSPAHNEKNNLEMSASGSLHNPPLGITSSSKMRPTTQEEIELSTFEGNVEPCKKRSKKKSLDTTKANLMEHTQVPLSEDENSFSKKKRLSDFDSPLINCGSKKKKTHDMLTPDVSLNLEMSASGLLHNPPLGITSSSKMRPTTQEEIELSTLEDKVEPCKKRSKKKSLDTTKATLMEHTQVKLSEDENSFSKKKRLSDLDSPLINCPSKKKKTDDMLTPDVSLKETVVAMMQLTDNPKPGRKIPEMSKEAQEKIDQHIAAYLSKQENEQHKKQDDSTNSSLEDCDADNEESNRSSQGMMEFLDDMADEGEESSVSDDSNAIPDDGESVGYSSNDNNLDESYEKDSFIDDEEYDLLSDSEEVEAVPPSSDKRWSRIVTIDSSSEEDDNVPQNTSENSLKVHASSSSEDETSLAQAKRRSLYKTHLNQTNHSVRQQDSDASLVGISIKSPNISTAVQENVTKTPDQINQSARQQVSEVNVSPVFISPKPRKTSITIQENISVKDIKDESLRDTISDVVEMFCRRSMPQGEVTLNVSLNYTPISPGAISSSEDISRGTTTASDEVIGQQETTTSSKKRRRRNRKRKHKTLDTEDGCPQNAQSASPDGEDKVSDKIVERQVARKKQLSTDSNICLHSPGRNCGKEYCKENVKFKNQPIVECLQLENRKQKKRQRNKKKTSVDDQGCISSGDIYPNSKETDKFDHLIAKDIRVNSKEPRRKRRKISASTSSNDAMWTTEVVNMKPSGSSNQQISHSSSEFSFSQIQFHPKDFRSKMLYDGKRVERVKMSRILKGK